VPGSDGVAPGAAVCVALFVAYDLVVAVFDADVDTDLVGPAFTDAADFPVPKAMPASRATTPTAARAPTAVSGMLTNEPLRLTDE
jgi:hypothetical protein